MRYSSGKAREFALFFVAGSLSRALCILSFLFVIKSVMHTFGTRILTPPRYRSKVKYTNHVCSKCLNAYLLHPLCIRCDLCGLGTAGNPRMHFTLASQHRMLWCKVILKFILVYLGLKRRGFFSSSFFRLLFGLLYMNIWEGV